MEPTDLLLYPWTDIFLDNRVEFISAIGQTLFSLCIEGLM